jgi:hypothetical protein
MFSGVFIGQEFDAEGGKGSGDTTMVDMQTIMEAFLHKSLRSACFTDEVFLDKKKNFWSWNYYPQVLDYQKFHHGSLEVSSFYDKNLVKAA